MTDAELLDQVDRVRKAKAAMEFAERSEVRAAKRSAAAANRYYTEHAKLSQMVEGRE